MTKRDLTASVLGLALAVFAVGCDQKESATNTRPSNANGNTAVVVNANGNTATGTTSRADDNNWDADIKREDFDKDKAKYERRAKDSGSTIGQGANDLWIWTKTRTALATTEDLRDSTVNVDVENDTVTLKGTVRDAKQKAKAEQVAKGIEGVKSVRNTLTVAASGDTGAANTNAAGAKSDKK